MPRLLHHISVRYHSMASKTLKSAKSANLLSILLLLNL